MPYILIIGATGVGKTAFSNTLSELLPIEIINGDMGQFYTKLTIGTAKPAWFESKTPHHLFDIIKEPGHYSASSYRAAVQDLINQISVRGKMPVIVGGSTLYALSLFYPPQATAPISQELLKKSDDYVASLKKEDYWSMLSGIDAKRAEKIHPHDTYRLERALKQWATLGKSPSALEPSYSPIDNRVVIIDLSMEKELLVSRLGLRIYQMVSDGWCSEVEMLLETPWESWWKSKKIIGYEEIASFVRAGMPFDQLKNLVARITQKSMAYVKKQKTFFRMLSKKIANERDSGILYIPIDLTLSPSDLYIKQLCADIAAHLGT